MIRSRRGPQIRCCTYDEAETLARSYAERVGVHVWRHDRTGLHSVRTGPVGN